MKIRKIRKIDIKTCARILENAYGRSPYNEVFVKKSAYKYVSAKFNMCRKNSFVVIDLKNHVVAFVFLNISTWCDGPQAILEEIVVDSNLQGKGIGKQLIKFVHNYLHKAGISSIMLWAKRDTRLLRFYEKNGYVVANDFAVMFKNF